MTQYQIITSVILVGLLFPSKVKAASETEVFIAAICGYVKIDNRSKIRKKLKTARLKLRKIYPSIRCDGKKLHAYALDNNSESVVKFLEAKIKAKHL